MEVTGGMKNTKQTLLSLSGSPLINAPLNYIQGVTMVGGAPISKAALALALSHAPNLIAVDGGANQCLRHSFAPDVVVGDFDSIHLSSLHAINPSCLYHIHEQETTDLEKTLYTVSAPLMIGVGFLGARVDHSLAALSALGKTTKPCILLGSHDVIFHAFGQIELKLKKNDRLSLFPLNELMGESQGLGWPINGISFSPLQKIGCSNTVISGRVSLCFANMGMLCIVSKSRLKQVLDAVLLRKSAL